jgi:deoxyribodipyrimidine photo-lyase
MNKLNLFIYHVDIRSFDNTTLIKQIKNEKSSTPIIIFTPDEYDKTKNKYYSNSLNQFMVETINEYNKLNDNKIYCFMGDVISVLKNIHSEIKINSIGYNFEYTEEFKKLDNNIKKFSKESNIKIYSEEDMLLFNILDKETLNSNNNKVYLVFTPYYNNIINNLHVRKIDKFSKFNFIKFDKLKNLKYSFDDLDSLYIDNPKINVHGGRIAALNILNNLKQFDKYEESRNTLNYRTTMLSAYTNLNIISIREVYHKIVSIFGVNHGLIRELIFREFYCSMIYHFPNVLHKNFYPKYDNIKWVNNTKYFNAWKKSKTGYPCVDAAIRQLIITNYMHNRMRMLTASFLIKNLQIDWRKGEQFFAQNLVDYNQYSNWGGWTGIADCAPSSQSYFRVFSPEAHSRKYDKECIYIKQWLPELKDVPNEDIHSWEINYDKYLDKGIKYYPPIVDFKKTRDEFIKFYKKYM